MRTTYSRALALLALVAALAPAGRLAAEPTPEPRVTLAAVGDIMLARSIGWRLVHAKHYTPFGSVAEALSSADIALGNLECAIGTGGAPARKGYTFRAPPAAADALADAGFDLVSLANNHSLDYGAATLTQTLGLLDERGIAHVGAGANDALAEAPTVREVGGLRLAFLAYVDVPVERGGFDTARWRAKADRPGVAWAEADAIATAVAAARAKADLVIVLLHTGYEGQSATNKHQRAMARAAVDAGAALVIGAHPHVLQGVEQYHGGVIAYSLGNFVFDGLYARSESAILSVTLTRAGVAGWRITPMLLRDGSPQPATAAQAGAILKRVARLSAQIPR